MRQRYFALIIFTILALAACTGVTPTPEPPATVEPSLPAPVGTELPDDSISATPMPPGLEQPDIPSPYAPQPQDASLLLDTVFIDATQIVVAESFPPQFFLSLTGSLPTPCHDLRVVVSVPNTEKRIAVEVYSVIDMNVSCIAVLEPLNVNIPLGHVPAGNYEVWVNGQPIGAIAAP